MSPEPFPDDGPGTPEPPGQPVPEDDWDAAGWEALDAAREAAGEWEVPPEWRTGDLTAQDLSEAGFGDSGQADLMPPGPVLATLADAAASATALARLSDDELVGVIAAARRTESRVVWAGMAAVAEFAARRLVLTLDPDAVRRRKEQARKDAHVRRFQEASGNAGMVAREMPAAELLASWQHVEQRALDLRAAGVPGTLQELRVRAYLDLLQEQDTRATLPATDPGPAGEANGDPGDGPQDGPGGNGGPGGGAGSGPVGTSLDGGARPARPGAGPGLAALIAITVPLAAMQGQSPAPGEAAGFGLLDPGTTADLLAAAARHPRTRWCVTVLHPDGTAAAHGCAPGRHLGPPALSSFRLNAVIRGPCGQLDGLPALLSKEETRHGRCDRREGHRQGPAGRGGLWRGAARGGDRG